MATGNPVYLLKNGLGSCAAAAELADFAALPGWSGLAAAFSGADLLRQPGLGQALALLPLEPLPGPGYLCGQVSSTFDVAWELAKAELLPVWGFVLAARQQSGRGQLRRKWMSEPGNLYVTLRLPAALDVPAGALLTAYLVRQALFKLYQAATAIKWPNDLLHDGRKVGGILLEERGGVLLAGLGLNLRQAPEPEQLRRDNRGKPFPAGVLPWPGRGGPGHFPEVFPLCLELVKEISFWYKKELLNAAPKRWPALAETVLAGKGQMVVVYAPGFAGQRPPADTDRLAGVVAGLGADGELRILTSSGREYLLHGGTVSLEIV